MSRQRYSGDSASIADVLDASAGLNPWPLEPPRLETKTQKTRRLERLAPLIRGLTVLQPNLAFKKTVMEMAFQDFAEPGLAFDLHWLALIGIDWH